MAALIFIAVVTSLVLFLRTKLGKRVSSYILLKTPVLGNLIRETNAARTARTLSSLLQSGVDVIGSLDITVEVVQNPFFQAVIMDAKKAVGQGEPLSAAFVRREDLFPPFVGEMMSVGEETGQLAEMLKRLAPVLRGRGRQRDTGHVYDHRAGPHARHWRRSRLFCRFDDHADLLALEQYRELTHA